MRNIKAWTFFVFFWAMVMFAFVSSPSYGYTSRAPMLRIPQQTIFDPVVTLTLVNEIQLTYPRASVDYSMQVVQAVLVSSRKWDVDPLLIASVIKNESGFRHYRELKNQGGLKTGYIQSPAGAVGIMQITHWVWQGYNPYDLKQNIDCGTKYLKECLTKLHEVGLAVAAYNAGIPRVKKLQRIPNIKETQIYVKKVCRSYGKLISNSKRNVEEALLEELPQLNSSERIDEMGSVVTLITPDFEQISLRKNSRSLSKKALRTVGLFLFLDSTAGSTSTNFVHESSKVALIRDSVLTATKPCGIKPQSRAG